MHDDFRSHLAQHFPELLENRFLLGYSGGADSTALVHLCSLLGLNFVAGHLHHGMRAEADTELKLAEAWCQELGIEFVNGKANVPQISREMKIGLEEAGRNARYEFFRQAAARLECAFVVTAHTLDDQVETILMNVARGAGVRGQSGIPSARDEFLRPMLHLTRSQTRSYCQDHGLWFHNDPSNEDLNFSRARVRHRVIPELELINAAAKNNITRAATLAEEEDRFLDGWAAAQLEQIEWPLNGNLDFLSSRQEVAFDRKKLASLPLVLFRRALRLAVNAIGGRLDFAQLQVVARSFQQDEDGSVTTDGGKVVVEWNSEFLHCRQLDLVVPYRYPLTVPGETASDEFGWSFEAKLETPSEIKNTRTAFSVEIDQKLVKGGLFFRTCEPGDTLKPLGFDGTRKVMDLLSEAKLTRQAKARLPIVCDLVGPVWIPGICLGQRVTKGEQTKEIIALVFAPLKNF